MKFAKPPDPETIRDNVEERAYWRKTPDNISSGQHLTFEINKFEVWSFPRTQLVRFKTSRRIPWTPWGSTQNQSITERILELQFPGHKMTVQTDQPDLLLRKILFKEISILARGKAIEGPTYAIPDQADHDTLLEISTPYVFTGHITPDKL